MAVNFSRVPGHLVAYVAGANLHTGRFYMLVKDGHMVIVQAREVYSKNAPTDRDGALSLDRDFNYGLELIQTTLDGLVFGHHNWAFLLHQSDGTFRLRQHHQRIPLISFQAWASLVEMSDIEITQWIYVCEWQGLWRGREVDLFMAWDPMSADRVEKMTKGHRIVQGLDLTFEVLGHVVRDGEIVGLMTERASGRPVQFTDKSLVYDAVATLCGKRILLHLPDPISSILILDGKVRFLDTFKVQVYRPDQMTWFDEKAERVYWGKLREMFDELGRKENNYPVQHLAKPTFTRIIAQTPSPMRSLFPPPDIIRMIMTVRRTVYSEYEDEVTSHSTRGPMRLQRRRVGPSHRPTIQSALYRHRHHPVAAREDSEPPLISQSPFDPRHRRLSHPYRRTSRPQPTLPWSDASDNTSVSGESSFMEWECDEW